MTPRNPSSPLRAQAGFSLVEVLMAASILAIGMLGIAAMQVVTLRSGTDSRTRQTAAAAASGLLDTISAEGRMVALDKYTVNAASRTALSSRTMMQQVFTTSNPAVPPGATSVFYTTTTWDRYFDVGGLPVPAGDATRFYHATVSRTEPAAYGGGSTQAVLFGVKLDWMERGASGSISKTMTLNRYIMY